MRKLMWQLSAVASGLVIASAQAAINIDGADGSDGIFAFIPDAGNANQMTIDLGQAVTAPWNTNNSANQGKGVYDPAKWAVVFKYLQVNLPQGKTVRFKNHPSRAPVVWLVATDVILNSGSEINVDGANAADFAASEAGPGGFRGGRAWSASEAGSGGFGPGGGGYDVSKSIYGSGGGYATAGSGGLAGKVYGNDRAIPLIGGSGGSARSDSSRQAGGAGGGAILVAARGTMTIDGTVSSDGGSGQVGGSSAGGCGSGGAIRLIADRVGGQGTLSAVTSSNSRSDTAGGKGKIRIEANQFNYAGGSSPMFTSGLPDDPALVWPPSTAATLRPVKLTLAGAVDVPIPADPKASLGLADLNVDTDQEVTLSVSAANVPLNWLVQVRIVSLNGNTVTMLADPLQGTLASSTTTATFTPPRGVAAIQLRATKPGSSTGNMSAAPSTALPAAP